MNLPLIWATCVLAQSQKPPNPDSLDIPKYQLKPVTVTALRTERPVYRVPYAINVIGQENIQRAEIGLSLDETLRGMPGVAVSNRHNLSQGDRISIRGIGSRAPFGVRGLKIILDGIPLTMPDGQSQLNNIDLGAAGKIEILRGPGSALYGNAAGGLIDIHTQPAGNARFLAQPRVVFGANGLQKWQGKFSGATGKNTYFANFTRLTSDGFREHSVAKSCAFNAIGSHRFSKKLKLTSVLHFFDAPYLLNPSSLAKTDAANSPETARNFVKRQGAGKEVRQSQGGITLQYSDDKSNRLQSTVYGVQRTLFNPIPGRIIDLDRSAWGLRTVFSRSIQIGAMAIHWQVGADYEAQNDARQEFENRGIESERLNALANSERLDAVRFGAPLLDQEEKVSGFGPFVEIEASVKSKWILTLAGRYDSFVFRAIDRFFQDGADDSGRRTMTKFSPMAGLAFRPHPMRAFYFNYSTAFQTPTTTELSNRPDGAGGFNPNLQPENLRNFELGMKGRLPALRLDYQAAVYSLTLENMLIPFQTRDAASEEIFFRNAGRAKNNGLELWLSAEIFAGLKATLAYTAMDFVFEDFTVETRVGEANALVHLAGKNVPGVPPHNFYAGVVYEHATGVFAVVHFDWQDRYFANNSNGPPPGSNQPLDNFINDSFIKTDVRFGFRQKISGIGTNAFLGIDNLFDRRFNGSIVPNAFGTRFFEPAPGRVWYTGLSLEF
ncbi:MAG: TonB-dependent receptor family protein [bacterium]